MKKIVSLLFAAMLAATAVASLTACNDETTAMPESPAVISEAEEPSSDPIASMVNPWIDCKDLNEAREKAGFDFQVPENDSSIYRVIPNEMIEVIQNQDGREVVYRKSPTEGDISGDYNDYRYIGMRTVNKIQVLLRGDDPEKIHVAYFTASDDTYSVDSSDGLTVSEATDIIQELIALNAK